jgi:hypothetical protein
MEHKQMMKINKFGKALMIVMFLVILCSCANYQFGDVSRTYCGSTNTEIRAQIKVTLQEKGIEIGVDYCASVGLIDALILTHKVKPNIKPNVQPERKISHLKG